MSPTRVLIFVALAAALTVGAFFVLRRPPNHSDRAVPFLQFEPAKAVAINVLRPGGAVEAVRREPWGEWTVIVPGPKGAGEWPANSTNVRAALQILTRTIPTRAADASATFQDPITVSISIKEPSALTLVSLSIDSRVIAGQVLARAEAPNKGPPVWVEALLAEMLVQSGPRHWRDTSALPGVAGAARITLSSPAGTIVLARLQGRWALREPVAAPAEPDAIQRLASGLASVQILDFLDDGPPADAGLNTAGPSITLETDRRDPDTGHADTLKTTLRLGQQADLAGKGIYAVLARSGLPERPLVVTAAPLAGLSNEPAAYISKRALAMPGAEVAAITVGTHRFARSLDGWADARGARASDQDTRAIGAVLKLLTETRADGVSFPAKDDPEGEFRLGAVKVELAGGGGDTFEIGLPKLAGHGWQARIRSNGIVRHYMAAPDESTLLFVRDN